MIDELLFEARPRWDGAPPVCLFANRMAFKTRAELTAFRDTYAPNLGLVRVWRCDVCRHLHHIGKSPDPAGSSSGTGRSSK
jgi:hypothetical protein